MDWKNRASCKTDDEAIHYLADGLVNYFESNYSVEPKELSSFAKHWGIPFCWQLQHEVIAQLQELTDLEVSWNK